MERSAMHAGVTNLPWRINPESTRITRAFRRASCTLQRYNASKLFPEFLPDALDHANYTCVPYASEVPSSCRAVAEDNFHENAEIAQE